MRSAIHSIGAGLLGWIIGSVIAALVWFIRPAESEVLAISMGLFEGLVGALAVAVAATALHFALGWAGSAMHPLLAAHRALTIGVLGILWGVLSFMTTGALVRPLR